MKARDLMTSEPFVALPNDTVAHVASMMRSLGVGCIPIVDAQGSRTLLGLITDRDIVVRCVAEGHDAGCPVEPHMTKSPLATVSPDADHRAVIATMERAQVRRVPVIDAHGHLVGIIAQADIARTLGPADARLVEEVLERISAPTADTRARTS